MQLIGYSSLILYLSSLGLNTSSSAKFQAGLAHHIKLGQKMTKRLHFPNLQLAIFLNFIIIFCGIIYWANSAYNVFNVLHEHGDGLI